MKTFRIAFFGSSLVSAYWNGAATYYRGLLRALHQRGHEIAFYEPDAFDRLAHRDISPPPYAKSIVYTASTARAVRTLVQEAADVDVLVKASGVGVFDEELERAVLEAKRSDRLVVFWDVDAPATLSRVEENPKDEFRQLIPHYDLIFTYGGGTPVVERYRLLGARRCVPIYNALDPETHHPSKPDPRFASDVALLANRLPDREARIHEFFFKPAAALPHLRFLLAGSGWDQHVPQLPNLRVIGHVPPTEHNAFNATPLCLLNVTRESMASNGYSPATRVFEAAGAGACLLTDSWPGLEEFLEPGKECLAARSGEEVVAILRQLTSDVAQRIGEAARRRVLARHTYAQRAVEVERCLRAARAIAQKTACVPPLLTPLPIAMPEERL